MSVAAPRTTRSLRIALVANRYFPSIGGAQTVVRRLAQTLAKDHDVEVLTPRRDPAAPVEALEGPVRVRRFGIVAGGGGRADRQKPLWPGLIPALLRGRFDGVVVFPSLGPGAAMAAAVRRVTGRPSFLFTFDLLDYNAVADEAFPNEPHLRRWLLGGSALRQRARLAPLRAFDGVFALGSTEARVLRDLVPFCCLLPVPVDIEEFGAATEPFSGRSVRVGCVGRITPHKGQDLAVRAFAGVRDRLGAGARLLVAGAVDDERYWTGLNRLVGELGLADAVDLRRDLSREAVIAAFCDCDVHVVPVRFMNGGSIVQEAWAAGRPVVQSDRIDPSLVEPGRDGLIFPYPSVEALGDSLLRLAADRDLARRMGRRGRQRVEGVFRYERLARALEDAFARSRRGPLRAEDAAAIEREAWRDDAAEEDDGGARTSVVAAGILGTPQRTMQPTVLGP